MVLGRGKVAPLLAESTCRQGWCRCGLFEIAQSIHLATMLFMSPALNASELLVRCWLGENKKNLNDHCEPVSIAAGNLQVHVASRYQPARGCMVGWRAAGWQPTVLCTYPTHLPEGELGW